MIKNYKICLKDIYLEELNVKKLKEKELNSYISDDNKEQNDQIQKIELSGKLMSAKNDKDFFKYFFIVDFLLGHKFEISIVYKSYFTLDNEPNLNINKDDLMEQFNYHLWPYVVEQINSITSKMNFQKKIIIPSYGVVLNEYA